MNREQLSGILEARSVCARSLLSSLKRLPAGWSEHQLAERWAANLRQVGEVFPSGWYQPPPKGMSVLVGSPPDFERLRFSSLREPKWFPSQEVFVTSESIVYPYFSAVSRRTSMLGDYVATFYCGTDELIREWIRAVYATTLQIAAGIQHDTTYAELYLNAIEQLAKLGASNAASSRRGGALGNVGHTVPFFGQAAPELSNLTDLDASSIARLANARSFINAENDNVIGLNAAFTFEPQVVIDGYPMTSFHRIVVIIEGQVFLLEKFRDLFDYFGMTDWLGISRHKSTMS